MEKRGLGKGLGALISGTLGEEDASSVREVRVEQIRPNPYQPRTVFDPDKLAELVASVREHGVLQPVLLRRVAVDSYELIAGERRFRAAQEAGLRAIPALVKEYSEPQMLEVALIENVQREDISPVEAAVAYRRLSAEFGMTQSEIAKRVGKAQSTIANTLRLLSLPEPILESLQRGEIAEGHARTLLQVDGDAQAVAFEAIRSKGLSVREAERLTREIQERPRSNGAAEKPRRESLPDPNLAAVEGALRESLGTKVHVRLSNGVGRIEIEFYDEQQLEGLIARLTGDGL
jgi:ParB family chromosome partitioning protein